MNTNRADIAPLLLRFFPTMGKASSADWHFFLDRVCLTETPLDLPNSLAFDRWREKLAKLGYPVFAYSDADIAAFKTKADAMLKAEEARAASLNKTLVDLAREAPNWTAAEVLSKQKADTK